jgi:serine/threonine-protein kinase
MTDIKNYDTFVKIESINKGSSGDEKYYIETTDGEKMLLRISDIEGLERKQVEYNMMECVYRFGVLTPRPVDFGLCNNGKSVYSLLGWLDGEDAETAVLNMDNAEQYKLGIQSGEMLRKIHSLPAPESAEPWGVRFRRMIKDRADFYKSYNINLPNAELIIEYVHDNSDFLDSRPQTFIHGDFWHGNIFIDLNGRIGIIDFNGYTLGYGDPYQDLSDIMPHKENGDYSYFLTGLFNGYFDGEPPYEFFKILVYYHAFNALANLGQIAESQGEQRANHIKHLENTMRWFDDFKNIVPSWYIKNFDIPTK